MVSEAKRRANDKWDENNLEQINLSLPLYVKGWWKILAKDRGMSLTKYLQEAVAQKAASEGGRRFEDCLEDLRKQREEEQRRKA